MIPYTCDTPYGSHNEALITDANRSAVGKFAEVYGVYARVAGANNVRPIAVEHRTEPGAVPFYTLHVRLADINRTLFCTAVLGENALDGIEDFLAAEFGLGLDIEHEAEEWSLVSVYAAKVGLMVEEVVPMLCELDSDVDSSFEVAVECDPLISMVLKCMYALADNAGKKRTVSVFSLELDRQCEDCGASMGAVGCLIESFSNEQTSRQQYKFEQHLEEYQDFCGLLAYMLKPLSGIEFKSLNHACKTDEELIDEVVRLHRQEFEEFLSFMGSSKEILEAALESIAGIEGGGEDEDDHPTLH